MVNVKYIKASEVKSPQPFGDASDKQISMFYADAENLCEFGNKENFDKTASVYTLSAVHHDLLEIGNAISSKMEDKAISMDDIFAKIEEYDKQVALDILSIMYVIIGGYDKNEEYAFIKSIMEITSSECKNVLDKVQADDEDDIEHVDAEIVS